MDELNAGRPQGDDLNAVRDLLAEPPASAAAFAAGRARLLAALSDPPALPARSPSFAPSDPPALAALSDPLAPIALSDPPALAGPPVPVAPPDPVGERPGSARPSAERRPAWRRRAMRSGLVAAAASVVGVAMLIPSESLVLLSPVPNASASNTPTARQVLLAAATAMAKAPADGTYWRTRTVTGSLIIAPDRGYVIRRDTAHETWLAQQPSGRSVSISQYLGARPATPPDEATWRAVGAPRAWRYPHVVAGFGPVQPGQQVTAAARARVVGPPRPDLVGSGGLVGSAELSAIPGSPAELRGYLEDRITRETGRPHPHLDAQLRESCLEILSGLPVSPEVRASAYQVLASLPGMKAEGEVTDPLGRTGQAVSYRANAYDDVRFVIDPDSGLPLADERRDEETLTDGRAVEVGSFTAYEEIGWTDEQPDLQENAPQAPAEPDTDTPHSQGTPGADTPHSQETPGPTLPD